MIDVKRILPEDYMGQRPTKDHLAYYITFKPNVLPDDLCDFLVKTYDDNPKLHVTRSQGEGHFKFDQLNLTEVSQQEPFKSLHSYVMHYTQQAIEQYMIDIDANDAQTRIPKNYGYEHIRINRTMNNGKDGFGRHTDVGDYPSARRFVTALYYLATNEEGGDAAFPELGFSCKPVKGSMLIFPSTWQYLHCGLKPISNPKYIMTTFLHYL